MMTHRFTVVGLLFVCVYPSLKMTYSLTGCSKKTDTQFYFGDNFGNSAPILIILSLLQAEIYGA